MRCVPVDVGEQIVDLGADVERAVLAAVVQLTRLVLLLLVDVVLLVVVCMLLLVVHGLLHRLAVGVVRNVLLDVAAGLAAAGALLLLLLLSGELRVCPALRSLLLLAYCVLYLVVLHGTFRLIGVADFDGFVEGLAACELGGGLALLLCGRSALLRLRLELLLLDLASELVVELVALTVGHGGSGLEG